MFFGDFSVTKWSRRRLLLIQAVGRRVHRPLAARFFEQLPRGCSSMSWLSRKWPQVLTWIAIGLLVTGLFGESLTIQYSGLAAAFVAVVAKVLRG